MLSYYTQYNIAHGIYLTYANSLNTRLLHTSHKQPTMDKYKSMFPSYKYETYTRESFVLSCIYVMFYKAPSSFHSMMNELKELDKKTLKQFKSDIVHYESFIKEDISYLKEKYKGEITPDVVLAEFKLNKIKFYTTWFYLKMKHPNDLEEYMNKSRVNKFIYKRLKFIMLFITFKQEVIDKIEGILEEFIL